MEHILIIIYVVTGGLSIESTEFGDKDACEAARVIVQKAASDRIGSSENGVFRGWAQCVPKHSDHSAAS